MQALGLLGLRMSVMAGDYGESGSLGERCETTVHTAVESPNVALSEVLILLNC